MNRFLRYLTAFLVLLLAFVTFLVPRSDIVTISTKDFAKKYGDIVYDVRFQQGSFDEYHTSLENYVVLSVGRDLVKVEGNSYLSPFAKFSTTKTFTAVNYDNGVFCFVPTPEKTTLPKVVNLKDAAQFKSDYQFQLFDGYIQGLCDIDWLFIDKKGNGYAVYSVFFDKQDGAGSEENIENIDYIYAGEEQIVPVYGYVNVEDHFAHISAKPRNPKIDKHLIDLGNELMVIEGGEPVLGATNACGAIKTGYRSLLKDMPTNEEINSWCGKMSLIETYGMEQIEFETEDSIFAIAAFPPTPPIGPASLVKDYVYKGTELTKNWYLVQIPKSGLVPHKGHYYLDLRFTILRTSPQTLPPGTITYSLK